MIFVMLCLVTMAKKLIKTNGRGDAQELGKVQSYKAKPKPYREPDTLRAYRLDRERLFWKKYPEQRAEIEERVKQMQKEWQTQDKRK
jgi:hypothetical protein